MHAIATLSSVALLVAAVAQVQAQTVQPPPDATGCAGKAVFDGCWTIAAGQQAGCVGNDYACLCAASKELVKCFAQCPDLPSFVGQTQVYQNQVISYCGAVPVTTTTSAASSAAAAASTASAAAGASNTSTDSTAAPTSAATNSAKAPGSNAVSGKQVSAAAVVVAAAGVFLA
ncbi:hypothetical protein RI367_008568 [Sorochytrium milnesiophthora]